MAVSQMIDGTVLYPRGKGKSSFPYQRAKVGLNGGFSTTFGNSRDGGGIAGFRTNDSPEVPQMDPTVLMGIQSDFQKNQTAKRRLAKLNQGIGDFGSLLAQSSVSGLSRKTLLGA